MQKVLSAEEMREVDRLTIAEYGIPSIILMENAAHATARVITRELGGSVKGKSILILCGKGNNGGDGAALARILWNQGAVVRVLLLGKVKQTKGDARINFEVLKNLTSQSKIEFEEIEENKELIIWWNHSRANRKFEVIVDAVFGTGINRPMEGLYINFLDLARNYKIDIYNSLLVSIDLPSGLDADSADPIGFCLDADLTVTFTAPKIANVLPPARHENGEVFVVDIGSPKELIQKSPSQTFVAEKQDVRDWLHHTNFLPDSYKNKRGSVLLIVGSRNYSGAAVLVGNAAMQTGVGLVTVATGESAQTSVSARVLPEVITRGLPETENGAICFEALEEIEKLSKKADVIAIGSGLSSDESTTRKFVREVVEKRKTPIVIDADGLNSLSPFDLNGSDEHPLILTPHEGEFRRLLDTGERIRDRVESVRDFAVKHNVILVLKGERTLIAEPGGRVVINPTGNSGLGKAGNGDNLTGIITGFVAQGLASESSLYPLLMEKSPKVFLSFVSVVAAVYIAGLAGDLAEQKYGKRVMQASDVRECLAAAFRQVEEQNE